MYVCVCLQLEISGLRQTIEQILTPPFHPRPLSSASSTAPFAALQSAVAAAQYGDASPLHNTASVMFAPATAAAGAAAAAGAGEAGAARPVHQRSSSSPPSLDGQTPAHADAHDHHPVPVAVWRPVDSGLFDSTSTAASAQLQHLAHTPHRGSVQSELSSFSAAAGARGSIGMSASPLMAPRTPTALMSVSVSHSLDGGSSLRRRESEYIDLVPTAETVRSELAALREELLAFATRATPQQQQQQQAQADAELDPSNIEGDSTVLQLQLQDACIQAGAPEATVSLTMSAVMLMALDGAPAATDAAPAVAVPAHPSSLLTPLTPIISAAPPTPLQPPRPLTVGSLTPTTARRGHVRSASTSSPYGSPVGSVRGTPALSRVGSALGLSVSGVRSPAPHDRARSPATVAASAATATTATATGADAAAAVGAAIRRQAPSRAPPPPPPQKEASVSLYARLLKEREKEMEEMQRKHEVEVLLNFSARLMRLYALCLCR